MGIELPPELHELNIRAREKLKTDDPDRYVLLDEFNYRVSEFLRGVSSTVTDVKMQSIDSKTDRKLAIKAYEELKRSYREAKAIMEATKILKDDIRKNVFQKKGESDD